MTTRKPYAIEIERGAQKTLRDLDRPIRERIRAAIGALAQEPRPVGCLKLAAQERYRIRIGGYRVIYEIRDDVLLVLVVRIGPRGGVYDGM